MSKKRILVVEDSEDVRANLQEILEWANYEVIAAKDGKTAVDYALKEKPDLIICDIVMPELDGYGVLNLLSNRKDTANIPFIFLTAKSESFEHRKGMNLGADDYIVKPYDNTDLLKAIDVRLKKKDLNEHQNNHELQNGYINQQEGEKLLQDLFAETESRTYSKREFIYRQNSQPHLLFFISKGIVKLVSSNNKDKEYITALCRTGEIIGYTALLLQSKYLESAVALTEVEAYSVPKDDFLELLHGNKNVSGWLMRQLAKNEDKKHQEVMKMAYASVRKRIADALLQLHFLYKLEKRNEIEIMRDDLASIAGAAKETIVRTLRDFKDEQLVDVSGRKIKVLNIKKLKEIQD